MKLSRGYLYVAITWILSWFIIFSWQLFSNLWLSILEISILPFLPVIFILLPVILRRKQWFTRENIWPLLIFWLVEVFSVLTQFGGIFFKVPVAVIILLLYTQPLWTILLSWVFLKEKFKRFHIVSCIFVLWWVFFLAFPFSTWVAINPIGLIMGLLWGIFLSFWIMTGAWVSRKNIDPYFIKFSGNLFMIIFLFLLAPLFVLLIPNPHLTGFHFNHSWIIWIGCIIYAIFVNIVPHIAYFTWIKKVPAMSAGIIMLFDPVVGTILAMTFFHQSPTIFILIWWVLILLGNILVMIYGQKE